MWALFLFIWYVFWYTRCGHVSVVHVQAFLLFVWYTMWASALAAGLLLRSFIEILTIGDFEDTVKCAPLDFKP